MKTPCVECGGTGDKRFMASDKHSVDWAVLQKNCPTCSGTGLDSMRILSRSEVKAFMQKEL